MGAIGARATAAGAGLVLLLAVLAGCGNKDSSTASTSTTTSTSTSTTTASTTTTTRSSPTTVAPRTTTTTSASSAGGSFSGAHLVGQWYAHSTGFTVAADGTFSMTYRTYNDCSSSPPPCDTTQGNQIIGGGSVKGKFDHGAAPEWTGTITSAADTTAWPLGPIDARFDAATDTLLVHAGTGPPGDNALTLCGPSSPSGTCGA